jgi:hypothetical protein
MADWAKWNAWASSAKASPAGIVLTAAGYGPWLSGGNCAAWKKDGPHGTYLPIGDGNFGLGEDVPGASLHTAEWAVGLYNADCSAWLEEWVLDLQAAIMCGDGLLADPQRYLDGNIAAAERHQEELIASYKHPGHA